MKLNIEPLKSWFGFTRRERRSSYILLIIIIFIIGARYLVPEKNMEIENYGFFQPDTEYISLISDSDNAATNFKLAFNQPSETYDTVTNPVYAEREVNSTFTVRSGGGRFRDPSEGHQKKLIEINGCDSAALVALPGIGPVLSARIIKYRKLLGGFARVEQLKEVYGLPEETFELIKGRLYADSSGLRKIYINSADYRELSQIHYLEKYDISAILKYREFTGRINSIEDLKVNKILTPEKSEKVGPYLDFR
jgi:DNA uptake protein ComE-like DNA-binding protein